MIQKIFRNGEQVNEITTQDQTQIYKEISNIFICKEIYGYKTKITSYLQGQEIKVVIKKNLINFDNTTTKFLYDFTFLGVNL